MADETEKVKFEKRLDTLFLFLLEFIKSTIAVATKVALQMFFERKLFLQIKYLH